MDGNFIVRNLRADYQGFTLTLIGGAPQLLRGIRVCNWFSHVSVIDWLHVDLTKEPGGRLHNVQEIRGWSFSPTTGGSSGVCPEVTTRHRVAVHTRTCAHAPHQLQTAPQHLRQPARVFVKSATKCAAVQRVAAPPQRLLDSKLPPDPIVPTSETRTLLVRGCCEFS